MNFRDFRLNYKRASSGVCGDSVPLMRAFDSVILIWNSRFRDFCGPSRVGIAIRDFSPDDDDISFSRF